MEATYIGGADLVEESVHSHELHGCVGVQKQVPHSDEIWVENTSKVHTKHTAAFILRLGIQFVDIGQLVIHQLLHTRTRYGS